MDPTADDARALARAASQLAALSQPDVAAVVASLPRCPGSTASLTEVATAAGLDIRAVGKAVARGRDAGVLRLEGDAVGLDPDGADRAVADLVARTPLGAALVERPELRAEAPYGMVHGVPSGEQAHALLQVVVEQLPREEMTEPQVTALLGHLGDDPVGLRRALVDAGLLWRTPDGSRYRRQDAA